jgi:N-acyl-D-amino-acid deacylase
VTPGWVDIHSHYDGQATWDAHLTPAPWNGVSTVVMGNCGVGFAPVKPDQHEFLIQLMEGVVPLDIPCLMLMADRDPALRPEFAKDMPERCSNLEMQLIKEAGHWVQQEQVEAFNQHLLGWLDRHFPTS